jgi:CheY-like chemotaxis protein
MSASPARGSPTPSGLFGVLRLLRQAWSGDSGSAPANPPHETVRPDAPVCSPIRVLVADDNPVNQMAISAQMELRGLVTVLADNGAEAVAMACQANFDLILMDLQMPVLDGLEASAAIRRWETSRSQPAVPVIAYSSSLPGADAMATHGISGSLAKPCGDEELEDCLTRWCPDYRAAATGRVAGGENGAGGR